MQKNLDRLGGLVHSQRVLIALAQKGIAREDAYRLVQRNAMRVWQEGGDFLALLKADPDVSKALTRRRARTPVRPRLPHQARRHDLRARVRSGVKANLQAISRASSTSTMAPIADMTIWSTISLPRLSFQPAALNSQPPTNAPRMPVIR